MAQAIATRTAREKGFALVALTMWLPIFLAMATALSLAGFALDSRSRAARICFSTVIELQRQLRERLRRLEKLNTPAKRLRIQRVAAQAKLRAALASGLAPAIAAAQAEILFITRAQAQLRREQSSILSDAQTDRRRTWQANVS